MQYVLLGIVGFLLGYLFDLASLRPIRGVRAVLFLVHASLVSYAMIMLCIDSDRIAFPPLAVLVGVALVVLSIALEVYSLFINLPFRRTYLADSTTRSVVKTGTYSLVRHPSVLWYFFILAGFILVSGSKLLLFTAPLWMALDVLWVVMQEKFIFPKILTGYDLYQSETPMLIPTVKSTRAFILNLRHN